ncbi:hypothetical protein CISG_02168 [Coccidioides immitis RMSCC 3703]|uniref:Uncharacterized protein n=1 Tax=Coccidioides immitis RMSCC 3703 TaxID=454286 RepID=A0A0J8U1K0_COCIT|nr:hypothetical protein CISG_02168 [Coccidioides immitis RMSCC 3703]
MYHALKTSVYNSPPRVDLEFFLRKQPNARKVDNNKLTNQARNGARSSCMKREEVNAGKRGIQRRDSPPGPCGPTAFIYYGLGLPLGGDGALWMHATAGKDAGRAQLNWLAALGERVGGKRWAGFLWRWDRKAGARCMGGPGQG